MQRWNKKIRTFVFLSDSESYFPLISYMKFVLVSFLFDLEWKKIDDSS